MEMPHNHHMRIWEAPLQVWHLIPWNLDSKICYIHPNAEKKYGKMWGIIKVGIQKLVAHIQAIQLNECKVTIIASFNSKIIQVLLIVARRDSSRLRMQMVNPNGQQSRFNVRIKIFNFEFSAFFRAESKATAFQGYRQTIARNY